MADETVPLKFVKNSMITEDVYVEGKGPLKFLVTTDSPTTIIDAGIASDLGLSLEGPLEGVGAGGKTSFHIAMIGSLRLGRIILKEQKVAVFDFSEINNQKGFQVDGAVASDLLRKCKAIIDYGNDSLSLFQPD